MHERGGKIRLFGNYDYLSSRATFITRPDDWAIVRCMRHATDRHVLNQHGSRIGYIDSLRVIGAIGRVDAFNSRGTAWRGIHNCVGVVKLVAEKGAPVIEIKHIRVTEGEL